jgi:hypothetical protein
MLYKIVESNLTAVNILFFYEWWKPLPLTLEKTKTSIHMANVSTFSRFARSSRFNKFLAECADKDIAVFPLYKHFSKNILNQYNKDSVGTMKI